MEKIAQYKEAIYKKAYEKSLEKEDMEKTASDNSYVAAMGKVIGSQMYFNSSASL